jgi:hypothetical protein
MKLAIPSKPSAGNASVFIMTFNEAINLRRCLESVTWSDVGRLSQPLVVDIGC